MAQTSLFKYVKLLWFSGPAGERKLFRQMAANRPARIVEIGLGTMTRTLRMLDVARRYCDSDEISYTGIDLFDGRPDGTSALSMKDAWRSLRQQGIKTKLVPGDALAAMTTTANSLANTDLIIIDGYIQDDDLKQAWKYFPRMMHTGTTVLRQLPNDDQGTLQVLTARDIQDRIDRSADEQTWRAA